MPRSILRNLFLVLVLSGGLAACDDPEQKAEAYFQSGMELYEAGDADRAIVELRNVFAQVPNHAEARALLARIFLERGDLALAYQQYLRLIEQKPSHLEGRLVLAELAFEDRNWEEFERHGNAAVELDAANPRVVAIMLGNQYRAAIVGKDNSAAREVGREAESLLAEQPDNAILLNLLLSEYLRDGEYDLAMDRINQLIESRPDIRPYYDQRVRIASTMQDDALVETLLLDMQERFPEDPRIRGTLIRFYMDRGENDKVEAAMRAIADTQPQEIGPIMDLLRFLQQTQGVDAARTELDARIAATSDDATLRAMRATMDFQAGKRDEAVVAMEAILAENEPSEETSVIRVSLARMLLSMGNSVGAQRLVEEALEADPRQVDALKLKASWLIEANDPDAAISTLRQALELAPEDAGIMSLMSDGYHLAGNPDLARDFLAQAAEASEYAAPETLRYARLLIDQERYLPAEDVLKPALRRAPENVALMGLLGDLYLRMDDSPRLTQVIGALRRMENAQAAEAANRLEVAQINRQDGAAEALAFMEQLAASDNADLNTKLDLLRARMSSGDTEGALAFAEELLAADPDNPDLKFAAAMTQKGAGDLAGAETRFLELLAEDNKRSRVWIELARNRQRQGSPEGARQTVNEALAVLPDSADLLWAEASYFERDNNIEGAIANYEKIYAQNPNNLLAINNLASLLSAYRDDEESLNRAFEVARRLAGTTNPALADTYGWIISRRGNPAEALSYLELAAAALTRDPLVQIHLGLTYSALNRRDEAIAQLQKAIEIAGPGDTRPQIAAAKAELERQLVLRDE